jgi:hypothetical protein
MPFWEESTRRVDQSESGACEFSGHNKEPRGGRVAADFTWSADPAGYGYTRAIRPRCVSINPTFLFADLDRKLVK